MGSLLKGKLAPSSRDLERNSNRKRFWDSMAVNTYLVAILFVKVSILLLYFRTLTQSRALRLAVYVILFLLVSSHAIISPVCFSLVMPVGCQQRIFATGADYDAHCRHQYD